MRGWIVGRRTVFRGHIRLQRRFVAFLHLGAVFGLNVILLPGLLLIGSLTVVRVGVLRLVILLTVVFAAHVVVVRVGIVFVARVLIVVRLIIRALVDLEFQIAQQVTRNFRKSTLVVEVVFQPVELLINAFRQMGLPQVNDLLSIFRHVPGPVAQVLSGQIAHDFGQRGFFFSVDEFQIEVGDPLLMGSLQVLPNPAHVLRTQRLIAHLLHRIKHLPGGHFHRRETGVQSLIMVRFAQGILVAFPAHQRLLLRRHLAAGRGDKDVVANLAPRVGSKNSLQLLVA